LKDFKELLVWQKSHRLTLKVYNKTLNFPKEELYGLTSQVRRACVSIPANISEGCGRNSETELARFFQIAMGSASELEYHLLLAHDLGFLNDLDYEELNQELIEVKKMLAAFIKKLKADR
jgi:four helix bundle protein